MVLPPPPLGAGAGSVAVDNLAATNDDVGGDDLLVMQGQRTTKYGTVSSSSPRDHGYDPYTTTPSKMMAWSPPTIESSRNNRSNTNINGHDSSHLHYRQNFGKDGIYVSPTTSPTNASRSTAKTRGGGGTSSRRNDYGANVVHDDDYEDEEDDDAGGRQSAPQDDALSSRPYGLYTNVSSSNNRKGSQLFEDQSDPENERPFDQPPSDDDENVQRPPHGDFDDNDSGIRDLLTASSMRALNIITPSAAESGGFNTTTMPVPTTPPRVSRIAPAAGAPGAPAEFDVDPTCSPQSTKIESVWLSSPEASPKVGLQSKPAAVQLGLFTIPPPKVSDPSRLDERLLNLERQQEIARRSIEAQKMRIYQIGGAAVTPSNDEQEQNDETDGGDTLFDFVEKEESNEVVLQDEGSNDDDLLNKNIRITHRVRRKVKQRRKVPTVPLDPVVANKNVPAMMEIEDDTSTEQYGVSPASPSNLQERAHQAWKSRQKKNSSLKSKQIQDSTGAMAGAAVSGADTSNSKYHRSNVSFGKSDTVHHFETVTANGDDTTLGGRSLTSEYTKTMESEVEDMIKDLMFIGDGKSAKPGRRQFRYKPSVKRKLRKNQIGSSSDSLLKKIDSAEDDDDDDDQPSYLPAAISSQVSPANLTNNSYSGNQHRERGRSRTRRGEESQDETADESTISADDTMTSDSQFFTRRFRSGDRDDRSLEESSTVGSATVDTFLSDEGNKGRNADPDDPFATVLGYVENGISAMSSAIEYAIETAAKEADDYSKKQKSDETEDSEENNLLKTFDSCTGKQQAMIGTANVEALSSGVANLTQDTWFHSYLEPESAVEQRRSRSKRSFDEQEKVVDNVHPNSSNEDKNGDNIKVDHTRRMLALGNGEEVAALAVLAAHSLHRLQGIEYNDSVAIDMYHDLKICEVHLILPLGIVFMENDGGCFVTKVSPDGSAARSGGVEVGDQLAAINRISALNMKVDDVFNAVSNSPQKNRVDLVFIRYVGPFRPDEKVPPKGCFSNSERPRTTARGLLGRKKDVNPPPVTASTAADTLPTPVVAETAAPKKVAGFRLFGRGKNKASKDTKKISKKGKNN
mmetsp:Transcript_52277/g.126400  ORF Transcript_52277/g.126400 Transcript_52277/m.126400 type:complete len:1083 (-) Transcript_52277:1932-5180(-)